MLKAIETENVIKNIIKEIIRECSALGIKTNESLAAYVIKLVVVNPDYGFITDQHRPLQREDVERLVDLCVRKLSETGSASLGSIKMQVYFESHFAPRETLIEENRENIKNRTSPLLKEMIETNTKVKDDIDKLYRKLVVAIILTSGLGNPTNSAVLKEATVALQSVFPLSELTPFMQLTRQEKEDQVKELTQIVTGIRLFNRDCQKGGEGIDDLPEMLQKAVVATIETLQLSLQKLLRRVYVFTSVVEGILEKEVAQTNKGNDTESTHLDGEDGESEDESTTHDEDVIMKDVLAAARVLEGYIRKLLSEALLTEVDLNELLYRLETRLQLLHETVKFRTAIPTIQVYPQFIDLSHIWCGLQDVMVVLSVINNISWNLQSLTPILDQVSPAAIKQAHDSVILTDAERLEVGVGHSTIDKDDFQCGYMTASEFGDFDNITLEYNGFCGWALVTGEGALLPGNPNLGVCEWLGKYYAFSSVAAAKEWGLEPQKYVSEALKLVRFKPELIGLLQLRQEIEDIKAHGESPLEGPEQLSMTDCEIQTELHPVESFIDPDYTWNEWELRRRAVKLANICKCKTHSTQTKHSNFRAAVAIQAAPDKTKACQTKRDNSTNVPTLQNFIYGLRKRVDQAHVVTLTRPVDEKMKGE